MTHVRAQIRATVKTTVTGLATTGSNVFASRVRPVSDGDLPCLLVYTLEEESEPLSKGSPPALVRTLDLVIEGLARSKTALDDALDQIAAEVEAALAADLTLGGLARFSALTSSAVAVDAEGDSNYGAIRMTLTVEYHTAGNDPETAL